MTTKKIKVRVKKKRLKIKSVIIFLIILSLLYVTFIYIKDLPIKNIYIVNNNIVSDGEIIKLAKIVNYPPFIETFRYEMKNNILKNDFIKSVKITKTLSRKVYVEIEEYKVICQIKDTNTIILETGKKLENIYNISEVPILVNDVSLVYDDFIKQFSMVNKDIMLEISEIEYSPVEVDKERFLLYMDDDNYVYITLTKIASLNKYNDIVNELEGKVGTLYLDSGNYFEER